MSANPRPLVATLYNPHNQPKESLIAGFVARRRQFERLFRELRDAQMTAPEQHYLVQGLRGMGKTTLLLRLAYEIENTPDLRQRLVPIVFNEEEYGIGSLADLWERTARYLEEADPPFAGLYDEVISQYGQDDYERRALDSIVAGLQRHQKKLLLLIDNIGDLLKKLSSTEAKRLREVLLTCRDLRLIGATSTTLDTHDYTKPFYEFFKPIYLPGLTRDEAIDLFIKLGDTYQTETVRQIVEQQPGRIEAIRRLTGGVIRTMVLLFEILAENNGGSIFRDLNILLDRVTPLYKHRLDDLPAQQQKIVAALAQSWDAASTRELAQAVRLESKVVSAQLTQLINNGVVEKVATNTKNHLYRLEERFFNIWYLMRFGRRTDQRVLWLVRFFEEMFGGNEQWLKERLNGHLQAMWLGKIDAEAALLLTTAFAAVLKDEEMEDFLKKRTRLYLTMVGRDELVKELGDSKYDIVSRLIDAECYKEAIEKIEGFTSTRNYLHDFDLFACFLLGAEIEGGGLKTNKFSGYGKRTLTSDTVGSLIEMTLLGYIFQKLSERKKVALRIVERFDDEGSKGALSQSFLVRQAVYLWNNEFNSVRDNIHNPFAEYIDGQGQSYEPGINRLYLLLLLAKKQYHTAYNYFQHPDWQLKDRYKPLYYATLHFLRDEYPTDYLRMGPELRETVDDLLAEIDQMAIDYA